MKNLLEKTIKEYYTDKTEEIELTITKFEYLLFLRLYSIILLKNELDDKIFSEKLFGGCLFGYGLFHFNSLLSYLLFPEYYNIDENDNKSYPTYLNFADVEKIKNNLTDFTLFNQTIIDSLYYLLTKYFNIYNLNKENKKVYTPITIKIELPINLNKYFTYICKTLKGFIKDIELFKRMLFIIALCMFEYDLFFLLFYDYLFSKNLYIKEKIEMNNEQYIEKLNKLLENLLEGETYE